MHPRSTPLRPKSDMHISYLTSYAGELGSALAHLAGKGHEGAHSAAPHCAHHIGSHRAIHRYGHLQQP